MCVYKIGELKAPHIQKHTHNKANHFYVWFSLLFFFLLISDKISMENRLKKQTNELKQQMKQFKGSLGFFSYNRNEPDERR